MDVSTITNLGVAGFAILVMWWMYDASSKRIDERDNAFRALEKEVRERIMTQLNENTNVFQEVLQQLTK
jgi:hypothetical protein